MTRIVFLIFFLALGGRASAEPRYLDVRTYQERREGYLPGSLHIPLYELSHRVKELSPYRLEPLAIYCSEGVRSEIALKILKENGFEHVSSVAGGLSKMQPQPARLSGRLVSDQRQPRCDPNSRYFGFNLRIFSQSDLDGSTLAPTKPGLLVEQVSPRGAGYAGGLRALDNIFAIGGVPLSEDDLLRKSSFTEFFPERNSVPLKLDVFRDGQVQHLELPLIACALNEINSASPALLSQIGNSALDSIATKLLHLSPDASKRTNRLAISSELSVSLYAHLGSGLNNLENLIAQLPKDPVLISSLTPHKDESRSDVAAVLSLLNFMAQKRPLPPVFSKSQRTLFRPSLRYLPRFLLRQLRIVRAQHSAAFARLSPSDREFLFSRLPLIARHMQATIYVDDSPELKRVKELQELIRLSSLVNYRKLLLSVRPLVAYLEASFNRYIERQVRRMPGAFSDRIRFGTIKSDRFQGQYDIIIDPGGNDYYDFSGANMPTLIVDLSGNDRYELSAQTSQPPFGSHLLFDRLGNDTYLSDGFGMGSAILGTSVLADLHGNDNYQSARYGQGSALMGNALVYDRSGSDSYRAQKFSQGFGGVGGIGILSDQNGNDSYIVTPADRPTHCTICNFSQGAGLGWRYFALGGLGILQDSGGDDLYEGNLYVQGAGYYGGAGVLLDSNGNDTYSGGRFSQGAGVHSGVGALIDGSGDDNYTNQDEYAQGAGYDLALGFLLDGAGKDSFKSAGWSQGVGAENGFGLLLAQGAFSKFSCTRQETCAGKEGPHEYRPDSTVPSVGLLVR